MVARIYDGDHHPGVFFLLFRPPADWLKQSLKPPHTATFKIVAVNTVSDDDCGDSDMMALMMTITTSMMMMMMMTGLHTTAATREKEVKIP